MFRVMEPIALALDFIQVHLGHLLPLICNIELNFLRKTSQSCFQYFLYLHQNNLVINFSGEFQTQFNNRRYSSILMLWFDPNMSLMNVFLKVIQGVPS